MDGMHRLHVETLSSFKDLSSAKAGWPKQEKTPPDWMAPLGSTLLHCESCAVG